MKFIDTDLQDYAGNEITVFKNKDNATIMEFPAGSWLDNTNFYAKLFLGKCDACTDFYKDSFKDFTYNSVLVAGLGFGLIPNELNKVNNCSKIDVVEINQEVINYHNLSKHLSSEINIIKHDIFEYTTEEKYDLIIIDIIWEEEDMSEAQVELLTSKFMDKNLNKEGVLYIPVKKKWLVNK